MKTKYKRVLLKITGELLGPEKGKGIDFAAVEKLAHKIINIKSKSQIELVIIVGSGNLHRGRDIEGTKVDKGVADYIGMMATVMNAMALQESMERIDGQVRVMSSLIISSVAEPYIRRKALSHLQKGYTVIIAGGVGDPFFTTDSAAALRAAELNCDVILKASTIDGVYDKDPKEFENAKKYKTLTYQEALEKRLKVMDATAFAMCQKENIPIIIFDIRRLHEVDRILAGEDIGTVVTE
jgi:uridylate kinase